jgi:hypothetical protein
MAAMAPRWRKRGVAAMTLNAAQPVAAARKWGPAGSVRNCTAPGGVSLPGWGADQRGRNSAKYS